MTKPVQQEGLCAFINVIDIQREQVIACVQINTENTGSALDYINRYKMTKSGLRQLRVKRKGLNAHRICTMFYDEQSLLLYLGYSDGQVECFRAMSLSNNEDISSPKASDTATVSQAQLVDGLQA